MAASDIFMGGLTGAGSGAAAGSMFGPAGTAIGGGAGLLLGGFGGFMRGRAKDKQKKTMAEAQRRLAALREQQRKQREMDLQRAMAMFGPVDDEMSRLYGG